MMNAKEEGRRLMTKISRSRSPPRESRTLPTVHGWNST